MVESTRAKGGLVALGGLLLVTLFIGSLVWGYTATSWQDAVVALTGAAETTNQLVVRDLRLPRAIVASLVGAGLAVAGTLMQALTRNPFASPGLLGVNAGASLLIVCAVTLFGVTAPGQLVWFALAGAALTTLLVYGLSAVGPEGATPLKLTLAGAALAAFASSLTSGLLVVDEQGFQAVLYWLAGSVEGRKLAMVWPVVPFFAGGLAVAFSLANSLNTFALGEEVAKGLGQRTEWLKLLTAVSVFLLAGAAVAMAGPIGFIGLVVPHLGRGLVGVDYRWLLPTSALLGSCLLLAADIGARFLLFPRELPVGVVTAIIGAPFFISLARRGVVLR